MEWVRRTVVSSVEPVDINVLWIDTSVAGIKVIKIYDNGAWEPLIADKLVKQLSTYTQGYYIDGTDGLMKAAAGYTVASISLPETNRIWFLGLVLSSNTLNLGYAFYDSNGNVIEKHCFPSDTDVVGNKPVEISSTIPINAKTFKTTLFGDVDEDSFFCNAGQPYYESYIGIATEESQSDWNQTNDTAPDYIKNKPQNYVTYVPYSSGEIPFTPPTPSGGGDAELSDEAKQALLNAFQQVAWINNQGQTYYDAIEEAFYPITSITAVFTQGINVIYDTDTLNDLKQYLVVTGHYGTDGTKVITDYTLSGTLTAGTSTITVTYKENITTTFTVTVTHEAGMFSVTNNLSNCTSSNNSTSVTEESAYSATISASAGYTMAGATVSVTMSGTDITSTAYNNGTITIASVTGAVVITVSAVAIVLTSISAVYTQSGVVYDDESLNNLKSDLVVTATYSNSNTVTLADTDYTLSGTLTTGTSVITVSYGGITTTFNVNVTARPTVSSITATYTQTGTVYTTDSLDSLKTNLVVKAVYTDTTEDTLNASDYTLSGTLTTGTSTITVSYSGKTTTFTVVVTAAVVTSIDALFTQGTATITTNNSLDDLRQYLVVTANYNNGTTSTVTNYTLSGTLEEGTSTITVTYEGKTDTFTVTTSQEGVLYQLATPKIADGSTRTDTGVKLADVDKDWSICYDYELTSVPSATSSSYSFGNINIGVSDAKARTSSLIYNPSANESTSLRVYMNGIVGNHAIGVITHSVGSKCVKYNIEYTIGGTKYPFTGTTPVQSHALIVSQATMQFGATNGTSHKFNRFVINDYVLTNEEITNFMTGGNE